MVVTMTVDTSKVDAWLRKLPTNVRKRGQQGMKEFGNVLVNRILQQARTVGIKQFRSNRSLFTSTRYVQKVNEGVVMMPKSGVYQDRAKPHYVTISRNKPMLYAWARRNNFRGKGFFFSPKPFVNAGIRNATSSVMPIMRPHIRAAIREAKS